VSDADCLEDLRFTDIKNVSSVCAASCAQMEQAEGYTVDAVHARHRRCHPMQGIQPSRGTGYVTEGTTQPQERHT
jgi:hypothetical protein